MNVTLNGRQFSFTEAGLFRDGLLFDSTVRLAEKSSIAIHNGEIVANTNYGVVAIDDRGVTLLVPSP